MRLSILALLIGSSFILLGIGAATGEGCTIAPAASNQNSDLVCLPIKVGDSPALLCMRNPAAGYAEVTPAAEGKPFWKDKARAWWKN